MSVTEKALVLWHPGSLTFHSINCSAKINLIRSSSLICAESITKQNSSIEMLFYLYVSPITTEFNNSYKSGFTFIMKIFHFPIIVSYEKEKVDCMCVSRIIWSFLLEYYDNTYIYIYFLHLYNITNICL